MTQAKSTKKYPVYTWHAEEVKTVFYRIMEMMRQKMDWKENDEMFLHYLHLHDRLLKLVYRLDVTAPVVYLEKDERELVGQVAEWVKKLPKQ